MRLAITLMMSAALLAGCSGDDTPAAGKEGAAAGTNVTVPNNMVLTKKEIMTAADTPVMSGLTSYLSAEDIQDHIENNMMIEDFDLTGDDGNFVISNLGSDEIKIGRITVSGFAIDEDETPYFDSLLIEDLTMDGNDYEPEIKIDKIFLNPPSYADFQTMTSAVDWNLLLEDNMDPDQFGLKVDLFIGSGYMEGFSMKDSDIDIRMDFVGWAQDDAAEHISLKAKDTNIYFDDPETGLTFDITMGDLSFKNLDVDYVESEFTPNPFDHNMFRPYFDSVHVEDLMVDMDSLYMAAKTSTSWFTEPVNGISHGYVSDEPLYVGFKGEPKSEAMQTIKDGFDKLGYERMEFSVAGSLYFDYNNDIAGSDGYKLIMKDGFELDMAYKALGTDEMVEKLNAVFDDFGSAIEKIDQEDPEIKLALQAAFEPLDIQKIEISITENSFFERAFKVAAEYQGGDVDMVKEQAIGGVTLMTILAQTPYQSELALDFTDSVGDFIEQGGTLKFAMKQDKSVDVVDVVWSMIDETPASGIPNFDPLLQFLGMSFEHIPAGTQ